MLLSGWEECASAAAPSSRAVRVKDTRKAAAQARRFAKLGKTDWQREGTKHVTCENAFRAAGAFRKRPSVRPSARYARPRGQSVCASACRRGRGRSSWACRRFIGTVLAWSCRASSLAIACLLFYFTNRRISIALHNAALYNAALCNRKEESHGADCHYQREATP